MQINDVRPGSGDRIADAHLPYGVRVAGAWAWRIIAIAAAAYLVVQGLRTISLVVVPLSVAALLAVLLTPLMRLLHHRLGLGRVWASLICVLGLIVFVVGLVALAGAQLASGFSDLRGGLQEGVDQIIAWLQSGPLHLTGEQLQQYVTSLRTSVSDNQDTLKAGAMRVGTGALDFLAGTLIALISTFFYLYEGERIWSFVVRLLPKAAQQPTYQASRRGWTSLGHYARTQVIVAGVDAVGIGLGALILGLPFVIPITLLVFISSFIPIVGAIVSGVVPVLIALVFKGPVFALIMLGIVLLVQQVEAHALQPFLMGKAVSLHPLAVIIAIAIGSYLLGLVGALFAVPVLAAGNSALHYLAGDDPFPELGEGPVPQRPPRSQEKKEERADRAQELKDDSADPGSTAAARDARAADAAGRDAASDAD